MTLQDLLKEFEEKYYDINTPSGLNNSYGNFKSLVDDIFKSFLTHVWEEAYNQGALDAQSDMARRPTLLSN